MHVTHSIIDSCALAIQTKAGTIIHTADFKIDHTPHWMGLNLRTYIEFGLLMGPKGGNNVYFPGLAQTSPLNLGFSPKG